MQHSDLNLEALHFTESAMDTTTRICLSLLRKLSALGQVGQVIISRSMRRLLWLWAALQRLCSQFSHRHCDQHRDGQRLKRRLSASALPPFTPSSSQIHPESAVVLACSSSPTVPAPVRTRPYHGERHPGKSLDSVDTTIVSPISPTDTFVEETLGLDKVYASDQSSSAAGCSNFYTPTIPQLSHAHPNAAVPAGITCVPLGAYLPLVCLWPGSILRYDRNIVIDCEQLILSPVKSSLSDDIQHPPGWTAHVHPDGQLYFYSDYGSLHFLTLANLHHRDTLEEIERFRQRMDREIQQQHHRPFPENFEIVLEPLSENELGYYMVNHDDRCLFWLQEFDTADMTNEFGGMASLSHFKNYMESEYWSHCEWFPHHKELHKDVLKELTGILLYGSFDTMTSLDSTQPYSSDEFQTMLSLVKHLHGLVKDGEINGYVNASVGRLMQMFAQNRFYNFYGQHGARLSREQSVLGKEKCTRSLLSTIISPLLFCSPDTHLRGLEKIWVDRLIAEKPWKHFVGTLKDEWVEFILYATVLLNANVAFLAIQGVEVFSPQMSMAMAMSLLSVIDSLGAIILGLLLVRQYRTKAKETAADAARYLAHRTHPRLGLETLAIMYSLPYALLMWGMVTFLAAIAFMSFQATTNLQRLILAPTWLAVAILITWTIITGWEASSPSRFSTLRNMLTSKFSRQNLEQDEDDTVSDENSAREMRWPAFRRKLTLRQMPGRYRHSNHSLGGFHSA